MKRFLFLFVSLLPLSASSESSAGSESLPLTAALETRVAFLVGNSEYQYTASLANPVADIELIATTLRDLDFEVSLHTNLTRDEIGSELSQFLRDTQGADVTMFYFAGHGMQFDGENFLIGVDARLTNELDVESEALNLSSVINLLERNSRAALVFVDACRNNPLADRFYTENFSETRALAAVGLAPVSTAFEGTMVTFSASPGQVAYDGETNSPFAISLARHLPAENIEILSAMKRVIRDVRTLTNGRQTPLLVNDLTLEIHLNFGSASTAEQVANEQEKVMFEAALLMQSPEAWALYFRNFPDGFFHEMAVMERERIGLASAPAPLLENDRSQEIAVTLGKSEIRTLQAILNQRGYDTGYIDGIFGRKTSFAIESFQTEAGLPPNGELNSSTMAALGFVLNVSSGLFEHTAEVSLDMSSGQVQARIRQLQSEAWQFHLDGDFYEGIPLYEESRLLALTYFGPNSENYADANNAMGGTLSQLGRKSDAIEAFQTAIRINVFIGSNPLWVANDQANLASVLADVGRYSEASDVLKHAILTMENSTMSEGSLDAYSAALQTNTRFLMRQGDEAGAMNSANRSVEVLQVRRWRNTKQYSDALSNRAQVYLEIGRCSAAQADFELAARTMRAAGISESHQDLIYRVSRSKMDCGQDGVTAIIDFPFSGKIISWTYYFKFTSECENDHAAQITLPSGGTIGVMDRGLERCSGRSSTFTSNNEALFEFAGSDPQGEWLFNMRDLDSNDHSGLLADVWIRVKIQKGGVISEHQISASGLPLEIPNPW